MGSSTINLLNTGFYICLVFAVLFFLTAVILFFVFDIRSIFGLKTGRTKAKAIKEMEEVNKNTGHLRMENRPQTSKLSEADKKKGRAPVVVSPTAEEKRQFMGGSAGEERDMTDETVALPAAQGEGETMPLTAVQGEGETMPLTAVQGEGETMPLSDVQGEGETMPLSQAPVYAETTVLSQPQTGELRGVVNVPGQRVELKIIKNEMYIHTKEMIS